jgi:hypothetical protein
MTVEEQLSEIIRLLVEISKKLDTLDNTIRVFASP